MTAAARKTDHATHGSCCCSAGRATHAGPATSAKAHQRGHGGHDHAPDGEQKIKDVRDPVCGMLVDPHTAKHRHQHEGRTYYFCSGGCLAKFKAEPVKYLGDAAQTDAAIVP